LNYEHVWKALEELIVEFGKKGIKVPKQHLEDLKSAQTFIRIHNTEPSDSNVIAEIERYIDTVEINLLSLAETELGAKYADECMHRIYDARMKGVNGKIIVPTKFVAGVPKEDHWVRIQVTDLLTTDELDQLLSTYQLSSKPQENGYVLIHGTRENVKALIRAMSQNLRSKST
jgi:hypothetical protein